MSLRSCSSKGYKGITSFIVERDTPGLHIGKKEHKVCSQCALPRSARGGLSALPVLVG